MYHVIFRNSWYSVNYLIILINIYRGGWGNLFLFLMSLFKNELFYDFSRSGFELGIFREGGLYI